jgi:hypothetical protein
MSDERSISFRSASGERRTLAWSFEPPQHVRVALTDEDDRELGVLRVPSKFYGNYGGCEITVSPLAGFVALFMFSGQSEQGYELFRTGSGLEHLPGLSYEHGMGGPPVVFSPDDRYVVVMNHSRPYVEDAEHADEDDEDAPVCVRVRWSELVMQQLGEQVGKPEHLDVYVDLPANTTQDPEEEWFELPGDPRFTSATMFEIPLPWDKVLVVELPMRGKLVAPPPDPDWRGR